MIKYCFNNKTEIRANKMAKYRRPIATCTRRLEKQVIDKIVLHAQKLINMEV